MLEQAAVDWEAGAPRSIFFDDIYFSGDGADEAAHVFLAGSGLAARFAQARRFSIGELGFGAGLNVLAAWDLWRKTAKPPGARLNVLSFEKFPLSRADLKRASLLWPQFGDLSRTLLDLYPPPVCGVHHLRLAEDVTLALALGDAREMLPRMEASVDAWFLDGFAPSKNPEMWSQEVLREIARLSAPGATAATFTVAGSVRRALSTVGFAVEKRIGFGRKREMLSGRIAAPARSPRRSPWFACEPQALSLTAEVAIIGGGVAGASLAYETTLAGLQPTIIDPCGIAGGASGNPAGLVMPRIDVGNGSAGGFFLGAYLHVLRTIGAVETRCGERFFNPCGVLLKAATEDERRRHEKILGGRFLPDGWIERRDDGLFFPQSGVVDPIRYCFALAGATPVDRRRAVSLALAPDGATIWFEDGRAQRFDAVVLANGCEASRFREARSIPLAGVMGQVDYFPTAPSPAFATAFGPYAAPAPGGGLLIGATYGPVGAAASSSNIASTRANIAALASEMPTLASALDPSASRPRAAVRCQTPDRMPVAGRLPDWSFYAGAYDGLRFGRRADYPIGRAVPGAYILAGLGSRGLLTAPFAAAMVAADMTGAPADSEIAEALHPARFFIRDLKRSRARLPLAAGSGLSAP